MSTAFGAEVSAPPQAGRRRRDQDDEAAELPISIFRFSPISPMQQATRPAVPRWFRVGAPAPILRSRRLRGRFAVIGLSPLAMRDVRHDAYLGARGRWLAGVIFHISATTPAPGPRAAR